MKAERNRDDLTTQRVIQLGLGASAGLAILLMLALELIASAQLPSQSEAAVALTIAGCIIAVVTGTMVIHWLVQRTVTNRILRLTDICRDYAGGEHTKRADVIGDDAFAMLSMALNTLLDSQALHPTEQGNVSAGDRSITALQVQVERLLGQTEDIAGRDLPIASGVSAESLGVLSDAFAYLVEALGGVVQQIQESSLPMLLAMQRTRAEFGELAQTASGDLHQLAETTQETLAQAIAMQHITQHAEEVKETARREVEITATGKEGIHQAITGLQGCQDHLGAMNELTGYLVSRLDQLQTCQNRVADLTAHLDLLAQQDLLQNAPQEYTNTTRPDLQWLAEQANNTNQQFAVITGQLRVTGQSLDKHLTTAMEGAQTSTRLLADIDRMLATLSTEAQRAQQTLTQFAHEAQQAWPRAEATADTQIQLTERLLQTHQALSELLAQVPPLVRFAEQVQASVTQVQLPELLTKGMEAVPPLELPTRLHELAPQSTSLPLH